jgi:hypothetical protein
LSAYENLDFYGKLYDCPDKQRKLEAKDFAVEGDTITIMTPEPVSENPDLIRDIFQAGGDMLYVTERKPKLEEVYLRIVRAKT